MVLPEIEAVPVKFFVTNEPSRTNWPATAEVAVRIAVALAAANGPNETWIGRMLLIPFYQPLLRLRYQPS
jgi:hypothetical protein